MAFNIDFLPMLLSAKKTIDFRRDTINLPKKLVSIGYPDLIVQNNDIEPKVPVKYQTHLAGKPEAMKWHGLDPRKYSYFSIQRFVEANSWEFNYIDIKQGTGSDSSGFLEADLNYSIPNYLYSNYDILIDGGTAEHCFNIGKVFENYFHMLKPGGILLQYVPFISPNHGFYSINPTLIYDIAFHNPIKLMQCSLISFCSYHDYFTAESVNIPFEPTKRFSLPQGSTNSIILLFFIYKKLQKSVFNFPIQSKYRR